MNISQETRRKAIILHAQDMMRLAGYDKLVLELDELYPHSDDRIKVYEHGTVYPCDGIIKLDHDCQLIDLAFKTLEGVKEIL